MKQLNHFAISGAATGLLLFCTASAEAYIGPGAGLSLIGALWALIAAVAAAVGFVVLWPVRQAVKRRKAQKGTTMAGSQSSAMNRAAACETTSDTMHATPEAPSC